MIEVKRESGPPPWMELERCCFCRAQTPFWFEEKDVACCERCARVANAEDVPTKAVSLRRERIAAGMVYNAITRRYEEMRLS